MTDDEKVQALAQVIMGPSNDMGSLLAFPAARRMLAAPHIHITIDPPPDPVDELVDRWCVSPLPTMGDFLRAEVAAGRVTIHELCAAPLVLRSGAPAACVRPAGHTGDHEAKP